MALAESRIPSRLEPLLESVARGIGRYGIKEGDLAEPEVLRVALENGVRRIVQVYWTPFQIQIEGPCIGLYLEADKPRVHWAEAYISPDQRSWVLCFHERPDGEIQLAYHRDYETPQQAIDGFFKLSAWYVLTATNTTWADVVYNVSENVGWHDSYRALAGTSTSSAIQETLKKSTIVWLRWQDDGVERTMPVWYFYDNKSGKIYVLSGERQQTLPGAANMRECDVIFRLKGKNVRVAEVPASVRVLPTGAEWDEVAERIAEKRLNIPGLPEETAKRWRDQCEVLELSLRT